MQSGRSRLSNHGFSHERPLHEKADVGRKPSNDGSADEGDVRCKVAPEGQLRVHYMENLAKPPARNALWNDVFTQISRL
jgi:hypothetical protein